MSDGRFLLTWDPNRNMHYFFNHAKGVYLYQDGTEVALTTTKMATDATDGDAIGSNMNPGASISHVERELKSTSTLALELGYLKLSGSHSTYDRSANKPRMTEVNSFISPFPLHELSYETSQQKG